MVEIILKFTEKEWNDLVEANDPLVGSLTSHIDERNAQVNDDYTIKLKVGGKNMKTLTPRQRAKREEDEKANVKKQKAKALQDEKDLKEDRELIAKIWAKSSSLRELYLDLREVDAAGPISKKREAVFALNNDKKFLTEFKLETLPKELENFTITDKALVPKVHAELKTIFDQMIKEKIEDAHWIFGDFEGQSILKNITKSIAKDKSVDEEKFLPKVHDIIIAFFKAKIDELPDDDYTAFIVAGDPMSEVIFTNDFMKKFKHEL